MAEAFHQLGNQVIVVGRRPWALEQVMTDNSGMQAFPLDLDNPSAIQAFGQQMAARFAAEMGKFDATFTGLNGTRGMRGED